MRFMRVVVGVVVGIDASTGLRMRARMTVGVGGGTNGDWHNSLVGYAAAFSFSEHGQPSQNTSE